MLKRILGTLAHHRPQIDAAAPPLQRAADTGFITTHDSYGRELRIRRTAWRANVLLPGLEHAWNDPEALYGHLVSALDHGFAADLDAASNRLLAIDSSPQRAQAVRSIVLMETGRLAPDGLLEPDTVGLDRPVWTYGLRNPSWLVSEKPADAPLVTLVAFTRHPPPDGRARRRRVDEMGDVSRSAVLYLAEAVHQWTGLRTDTVIPVIDGDGPVAFEEGDHHADLCAGFGEQSAYLVSGDVHRDRCGWRLVCRLWDCANRSPQPAATIEAAAEDLGVAMLELERRLLARLGPLRAAPLDRCYTRPPAEALERYLAVLAQGFLLTLAANGMIPKSALGDQRRLLEAPLDLALRWPAAEVHRLMLLSALVKAAACGSGVLHEFKARTIELMQDARRNGSAAACLDALALQVFGMRDELARQQASLAPDAPDDYRQWLARRIAEADAANPPRQ